MICSWRKDENNRLKGGDTKNTNRACVFDH
jgi:hypothetical protein